MNYLFTHLGKIGASTLEHVLLVVIALAIALVLAFPLSVAAARKREISSALFGLLGAVYALPSLALLAVLVRVFGLGTLPVVVVLVAYAQFILVRNFATALREVPAAQVDAARGMGMSPRQSFWRIEMPLAFPVMLGGVRVAVIAMIAIATLGGYVGAGGLGDEIFTGLQLQFPSETLAGSIPAALLALLSDAFFRSLERLTLLRAG